MNRTWHLRAGRVVDPLSGRVAVADLLIVDGVITSDQESIPSNAEEIDATGLTIVPGLVDIHVHFRDPGNTQMETIETGSAAAARGGFTTVVTMPNTSPPLDTPEGVIDVLKRGQDCGLVDIKVAACISRNRSGAMPTDIDALAAVGAAAISDDGSTVTNADVMRNAAETAARVGIPILDHALDPIMAGAGVMRRGLASQGLDLPGIPAEAEWSVVQRNAEISKSTGCHIHIQHVSTRQSIDIISSSRSNGIRLSGEATPHHLAIADAAIERNNTNFKMSPPLGSEDDREALLTAVADGRIEILATDHAPHSAEAKAKGFVDAPFGVTGLETAVGVTYSLLVKSGRMSLLEWVRRWTTGPAGVIGMKPPTLSPGSVASLAVLDLETEITVGKDDFLSKSSNSLFIDYPMFGRAVLTFLAGAKTWDDSQTHKPTHIPPHAPNSRSRSR